MPITRRRITAFDDQVEILATMDIGRLWDRMLNEFLNEWVRLQRTGLTGVALEREMMAFINGLSPKPVEDLARTSSSVAYNQGRGAAILSAADGARVDYVVRSEILDTNTCEECAALDSTVVEVASSEFQELMPPARCLGGDRCRGFYIAIESRAAA